MTQQLDELLTTKEAAEIAEKHPSTIRRWIKNNKLPAQKISGKFGVYLIKKDDILEKMVKNLADEHE